LAVLLSTASPPLALYTLSLHDALPIFADFFPDTFSRAINSLLSAASDNDRRSFPRQRTGNREADSGGRSCDQRFLSIQFQIHSIALSGCAEKLLHRNAFEAEISCPKDNR